MDPKPIAGWNVRPESSAKIEFESLPLEDAPELPSWQAHGNHKDSEDISEISSESHALLLKPLLLRALTRSNSFLPKDFSGPFQLWLFDAVPYQGKSVGPKIVLSSAALETKTFEELRELLAHELHHVALFSRGFGASIPEPRTALLKGMLLEGSATWMTLLSGASSPSGKDPLDPDQVAKAFSDTRAALNANGGAKTTGALFGHNKAGYLVGIWMIKEIENHFGREAWVRILGKSPDQAAASFFRLYEDTEPHPEFLF